MRELERIDRITNKLNTLWKMFPNQHYLQLAINYYLPTIEHDSALFYVEDDILEERIDNITKIFRKGIEKL